MRWFLFLLILPCLGGCEKLNNQLQSQVLDCGEAARAGGSWIKVLDPQGQELPDAEQLDARVLELTADGALPPALPVSQKHCVNTLGAERLVIRSLAQDRSWSVLIRNAKALPRPQVQLQDNSQARVRLRCPEPWIQNGRFTLPLEVNASADLEAWALAPSLQSSDGRTVDQNFSLQSSNKTFIWPEDWPDGAGRLILRQRNLLQNPRSALAELEESCAVIIDRQKPLLRVTPGPEGTLETAPGALVKLSIEDEHPATLQWCLQPQDTSFCDAADAWQSAKGEASLPMPEQGTWILKARGWDSAGHEAEPLQQSIDVVRRDLIQGISSRVDQALAEKNEQSWDASLSLLRALTDYRRLNVGKEQELIRSRLINGILGASTYLQEFQRVTLSSTIRRAWALNDDADSPWLIQTDSEVSLWSAQGHYLDSTSVPFSWAADWSRTANALALGTTDELWVIAIENLKFAEIQKLRWSDHKDINTEPDGLLWIPGQSQILITFPRSEPALFVRASSGLNLLQRLDSFDNKKFAVSRDGRQIATVDDKEVIRIWRQEAGIWNVQDKSVEFSLKGLAFANEIDGNRLILLLQDGRLISWKPGVIWKDIEGGTSAEQPTEAGSSVSVPPLQTWDEGRTGLIERGGRFYQWSADSGKTLQPIKFSGFDWSTLRNWKVDPCERGVWMQDQRSLSYWEWQDGSEPGFYKVGDWSLGFGFSTLFAVGCQRDHKRFLTFSDNRLRFWSQRGPLPLLRGDRDEVTVTRFEKGRDGLERLFTAGFDGIIRLWNVQGQKLQEWIGHSEQVNELRYLPEWDRFATSAEDSTTRLWTGDGREDAVLSLAQLSNAKLRDAALAFDDKTMLTTGNGVIALWSQNSNRKELTITIPLQSSERSRTDSLVRLPGPSRILVRLARGKVIRALVVQADGKLLIEPGLPPLEKLKWLHWNADASRLALSDAQQKTRIFRYLDGSWVEESIQALLPNSSLPILQDFAFAPDGVTFAALGSQNNLLVGQWKDGQWLLTQNIPLVRESLDKGIRWTADSKSIAYLQAGQVVLRDRNGRLLYQFQAFPGVDVFGSFGMSQNPEILSVGAREWVRVIDFNLDRLQSQLCSWLDAYLKGPDAPPELSRLCAGEA